MPATSCAVCRSLHASIHFLENLREVHEKEIIFAVKETEKRMRTDAEKLLGLERAKVAGTSCSL